MPGFQELLNQGNGCSVWIKGLVVKSQGSKQPIEIKCENPELHQFKLLGTSDASKFVLHKPKSVKVETLREIAHLRPRTMFFGCVMRIRNSLAYATHDFFQRRGFMYIHTPILTSSDCEGAGEMFQVNAYITDQEKPKGKEGTEEGKPETKTEFFGKPVNLTVSGQLAVENFASALSDVYTFGPTFRAENSHTARHLAEFWMIEPEICFADNNDNMDLAEQYLKYCINYVLEKNADDLEFLEKADIKTESSNKKAKEKTDMPPLREYLNNVVKNEFKRVSYTEAIDLLLEAVKEKKNLFKKKVEWGMDLKSEHERYITEKIFMQPTFIYNYPKDIKSFYMKLNEDGKTVAAMDCLLPFVGEIIGGSQREENLELLEKRIDEVGLKKEDYSWYLDLRRFGSVVHSGFGLGFDRMVMLCSGIENIRDTIPYPRYPGHCEF